MGDNFLFGFLILIPYLSSSVGGPDHKLSPGGQEFIITLLDIIIFNNLSLFSTTVQGIIFTA